MSEKHVLNLKCFKWIFKYPNNYLESQLEKIVLEYMNLKLNFNSVRTCSNYYNKILILFIC